MMVPKLSASYAPQYASNVPAPLLNAMLAIRITNVASIATNASALQATTNLPTNLSVNHAPTNAVNASTPLPNALLALQQQLSD